MATEVDLTDVQIEPHGLRNVLFTHSEFRRRMLDKYGQCTKMAAEVTAVETTCKAVANLTGETNDVIAIVYGINVTKVARITELTVDSIDQCYMDAALDATKRLSICTDIYYKNKDTTCEHTNIVADGETGGTGAGLILVKYIGKDQLEFEEYTKIEPVVIVGNIPGEINVTITPRNAVVKGLKTDPTQMVNANMVYELPVHTLAEINAELESLEVSPKSVGMAYLEVRVNGNLIKTLSFEVVDNTQLEASTTISVVYAGESTPVAPIVFSGSMDTAIEITVEPVNCSVSGFASRPEMTLTSGTQYSFKSDSFMTINNEIANLSILAEAVGTCRLEITYPGGKQVLTYPVHEPEVLPDAVLEFNSTAENEVSIILGEKNPIPAIVATGEVNNTTRITVAPSNCSVSGFASDPDTSYCANANYVFNVADVDSINRELATLSVLPMQVGTAAITISYGEYSKVFEMTVKSVPVNVIVPNVDTCDKLDPGDYTNLKPVVFRGRLEKPSTTVVMATVNGQVKGVAGDTNVYTEDSPCTVTATSLAELNNLFAGLKIKPVQSGGVVLNFVIDGTDTYTFAFDIKDPATDNDYSNVVDLADVDSTLIVGEASDPMPLVFGPLAVAGSVVTVTPVNCTMYNLQSNPRTAYSNTNPYSTVVESRSALNDEFSAMKIIPSTTTGVLLDISIDGVTAQLAFTHVTTNGD